MKKLFIMILLFMINLAVYSASTNSVVLLLSPGKQDIFVEAVTMDGSAIMVEGCTATSIQSGRDTRLTATGTTVVLKGPIIELNCSENQLMALEIQGLTALKELDCSRNRLTSLTVSGLNFLKELDCSRNQLSSLDVQGLIHLEELNCSDNRLSSIIMQELAYLEELNCSGNCLTEQAFIKIFSSLPKRKSNKVGKIYLYRTSSNTTEENITDLTISAALAAAVKNVKAKNWKLYKYTVNGDWQKIRD